MVRERVQQVGARGYAAWFLTSMGTSHPSCTDAPLIEPMLLSWTTGATIPVREGVEQYVLTTAQFIEFLRTGSREGVLNEDVTHPDYDADVRCEERRKDMGRLGEVWQVHVAPDKSNAGRVG